MTSLVPSTFSIYEITGLSLSVVVGYEYAITFPQEIETIWRRKKSATTMLLLTIRWIMLLFAMCSFFQPFRNSDLMCRKRKNTAGNFGPWLGRGGPISTIWGRNASIAIIVFILGSAPIITNSMAASVNHPTYFPEVPVCGVWMPFISDFRRKYTICAYVTRASLILQDLLVLVLTWVKTWQQWKVARRSHFSVTVSTCLLRDGTVYFVILLILNVTQMVIFEKSHNELLYGYCSIMPLILTSRFMLNLRALGARGADTNADDSAENALQASGFTSAVFTVPVGNIGASLDLGGEPEGCREWYELDEFGYADDGSDGSSTHEIGFSSTGAVYEGAV